MHGIVKDFSQDELKDIFQSMVDVDLIQKQIGQYPTYFVTPKGQAFLRGKEKIELPRFLKKVQKNALLNLIMIKLCLESCECCVKS